MLMSSESEISTRPVFTFEGKEGVGLVGVGAGMKAMGFGSFS